MTVQNVIRVCLVLIWIWLLMCVHRSLLAREWKGLQKRRRALPHPVFSCIEWRLSRSPECG